MFLHKTEWTDRITSSALSALFYNEDSQNATPVTEGLIRNVSAVCILSD